MPYPILTLPYGIQRRLRSLASPNERSRLHIAVGKQRHFITPMQAVNKYMRYHLINVEKKNDQVLLSSMIYGTPGFREEAEPINDQNDLLFQVNDHLRIHDLNESDFDAMQFGLLYIEAKTIELRYQQVALSKEILNKINSQIWNPTTQLILRCRNFDESVSFAVIFKLFPKLQCLKISESHEGFENWVDDILATSKKGLQCLSISGVWENLFCFENHKLVQLCSAQHCDFKVKLKCKFLRIEHICAIRHLLRPYFKEVPNNSPDVTVIIVGRSTYGNNNQRLSYGFNRRVFKPNPIARTPSEERANLLRY